MLEERPKYFLVWKEGRKLCVGIRIPAAALKANIASEIHGWANPTNRTAAATISPRSSSNGKSIAPIADPVRSVAVPHPMIWPKEIGNATIQTPATAEAVTAATMLAFSKSFVFGVVLKPRNRVVGSWRIPNRLTIVACSGDLTSIVATTTSTLSTAHSQQATRWSWSREWVPSCMVNRTRIITHIHNWRIPWPMG